MKEVVGVAPAEQWGLAQAIALAFFAGVGFTLAIVIMAGIREELDHCDVPAPLKGPGITLLVAGILSLAFLAFVGMDRKLHKLLVGEEVVKTESVETTGPGAATQPDPPSGDQ